MQAVFGYHPLGASWPRMKLREHYPLPRRRRFGVPLIEDVGAGPSSTTESAVFSISRPADFYVKRAPDFVVNVAADFVVDQNQ